MPTGFRPTFTHILRRAWLAGAAGGWAGFLIGGIGGRLAMFILRLTSDDFVRGVESDDGFTIGEFSLQTAFLLIVTAAVGSIAGIVYMATRPALPARWRRAMWTTVCGAAGGAVIIHGDGVDFTVLEPRALAIAMFIAIPAGGAWLMAYFIDRWQPWWARDRRKTAIASVAAAPGVIAGVGILPGAVIVGVALIAILSQVGILRTVARHVAIRAAVCLGFVALTAFALVDLTDDVRTLL